MEVHIAVIDEVGSVRESHTCSIDSVGWLVTNILACGLPREWHLRITSI